MCNMSQFSILYSSGDSIPFSRYEIIFQNFFFRDETAFQLQKSRGDNLHFPSKNLFSTKFRSKLNEKIFFSVLVTLKKWKLCRTLFSIRSVWKSSFRIILRRKIENSNLSSPTYVIWKLGSHFLVPKWLFKFLILYIYGVSRDRIPRFVFLDCPTH